MTQASVGTIRPVVERPVPVAPTPLDQPSLAHGARHAMWWAVMFALGENLFGVFGGAKGLPPALFGVMAGVPLLLGPLAQVWAANTIERVGQRKRFLNRSILLQAACFLPLVFLALAPGGWPIMAGFLLLVMAYHVTGQLGVPPWNSLIGDLVPAERRSRYFSGLNRGIALVTLLTSLAASAALYLAGSANQEWAFAGIFAVALLARLASLARIRRVREPVAATSDRPSFTFKQFLGRGRQSNFLQFVWFIALMGLSVNIAGPFFLPYALYDLEWQTSQWLILTVAGQLASIVTIVRLGRFGQRYGNHLLLRLSSIGIVTVPFCWLLTSNFVLLTLGNMVSGIAWAGFNLASFNYILEAVTPAKRARCVAYFNLIAGAGAFVGTQLGTLLMFALPRDVTLFGSTFSVSSGFIWLLLLSTGMRLLASLVLSRRFKELRDVERLRVQPWMLRPGALRPNAALRFDLRTESTDSSVTADAEAPTATVDEISGK